MHIHVSCAEGEVKFWLEPIVALASRTHIPRRRLLEMQTLIEERIDDIREAWKRHFPRTR